jgi:hypothetical protein
MLGLGWWVWRRWGWRGGKEAERRGEGHHYGWMDGWCIIIHQKRKRLIEYVKMFYA